jgi:hypothetical protein
VENGYPIVGMALTVLQPAYELETLFRKHDTDVFLLNMGPAGMQVTFKRVDHIQELLFTKANDLQTNWPGMLKCRV